jgi:hypothetical protein
MSTKITAAHSLVDNASVEFTQSADGVVLKVAPPKGDETDRVIVLDVKSN